MKFSKLYGTDEALPNFIKEIKMRSEEFEVFICHASEDKDKIARPLFDALEKNGIKSFRYHKKILHDGKNSYCKCYTEFRRS